MDTGTDERAEAQRGEVICLRAHSRRDADPGLTPGQPDSRAWVLSHGLHRFLTTRPAETQALDPRVQGVLGLHEARTHLFPKTVWDTPVST